MVHVSEMQHRVCVCAYLVVQPSATPDTMLRQAMHREEWADDANHGGRVVKACCCVSRRHQAVSLRIAKCSRAPVLVP